MITTVLSLFRLRDGYLAFALICLLLNGKAQGQTTLLSEPRPQQASTNYRNVLRLDGGAILFRNIGSALFNSGMVLPLLVGYERQLESKMSGNVEVLINGGKLEEKTSGLALQGRYYVRQRRRAGLTGFYVAPMLSSRLVKQSRYYQPKPAHHLLGGVGGLLGVQMSFKKDGRLLLDVSGGVMAWRRLNPNRGAWNGYSYADEPKSYYEYHGIVPDGRISLGYAF